MVWCALIGGALACWGESVCEDGEDRVGGDGGSGGVVVVSWIAVDGSHRVGAHTGGWSATRFVDSDEKQV